MVVLYTVIYYIISRVSHFFHPTSRPPRASPEPRCDVCRQLLNDLGLVLGPFLQQPLHLRTTGQASKVQRLAADLRLETAPLLHHSERNDGGWRMRRDVLKVFVAGFGWHEAAGDIEMGSQVRIIYKTSDS